MTFDLAFLLIHELEKLLRWFPAGVFVLSLSAELFITALIDIDIENEIPSVLLNFSNVSTHN